MNRTRPRNPGLSTLIDKVQRPPHSGRDITTVRLPTPNEAMIICLYCIWGSGLRPTSVDRREVTFLPAAADGFSPCSLRALIDCMVN